MKTALEYIEKHRLKVWKKGGKNARQNWWKKIYRFFNH